MRIIDWSSYVCSSDLLLLVLSLLFVGFCYFIGYLEHGLVVFVRRLVAGVQGFGQLGVLALELAQQCRLGGLDLVERHRIETALGGSVQIGRASCRERVCQYV